MWAEIKAQLPGDMDGRTYYEPFVGAGAVFFAVQPRKALINDYNRLLMLTYNAIKENVDGLVAVLNEYQKRNDRSFYYEIRNMDRVPEQFNARSDVEKAARLIFLNKTCFNGLYRVNASGFFNVPYGSYKNPVICEEGALRHISAYLNSGEISIINGDFEDAVSGADENAFVYFDPPYHSPDKTSFTGYQAKGFNEAEQERLCNTMLRLTERGVKCLLSNSDTDYIRALYRHDCFTIRTVQAKRAINADASGRGAVNEVLIKNWSG